MARVYVSELNPALAPLRDADGYVDTDSDAYRAVTAKLAERVAAVMARRRMTKRVPSANPARSPVTTTDEVRAAVLDAARREWERRGPLLWAALHEWGRTADLSTPETVAAARGWLDAFAGRVGCGECRRHWLALVAENPPDFTGNAALYTWTVDRHNDVNRRLGKPVWTPPESP